MIGCSNSLGLIGGLCSISYGFAVQVLSAVYIQRDGALRLQGQNVMVFLLHVLCQCYYMLFNHKQAALLQTISIIVNVFWCCYFFAVPVGTGHGFNSASYIFGTLINNRDYGTAWSFFLSWLPAIWTIGSFDSTIHCSGKNAQSLYLLVLVLLAPVEF